MAIEVECPKCAKRYRLADKLAGKRIRCKACQTSILVGSEKIDDTPHEDVEPDETPKKTKKKRSKTKSGGIPPWAFVAGGVGGMLVVAAVVTFIAVSNKGASVVPEAGGNPAPPRHNPVGGGGNEVVAAFQEALGSFDAVANAMATAQDRKGFDSCLATMKNETQKLRDLTAKVQNAGRQAPISQDRDDELRFQIIDRQNRSGEEFRKFSLRVRNISGLTNNETRRFDESWQRFNGEMSNLFAAMKTKLG